MLVEELARHEHKARRAEAALEGRALDEGFLHRIKLSAFFDRPHFSALGELREIQAARYRGAVDEHGAAPAQPLAAALARAEQAEVLAQNLDQRLVRGDLRLDGLAVQLEVNGSSQGPCIPPRGSWGAR